MDKFLLTLDKICILFLVHLNFWAKNDIYPFKASVLPNGR